MDLLKQLYCIHSPFYREWPMICFIREYIRQHVPEADVQMDSWGNLYVVKGEGLKVKDKELENTEIIRKEGATTPQSRMKLKDYVPNLDYIFEEFDTDAFDGSFYTKDGVLSELFSSEDILEALDEDGEKYVDEMSDEDIHDAVANVALLLNQGSIKSLEISDGNKIIYEDSNDKPFLD